LTGDHFITGGDILEITDGGSKVYVPYNDETKHIKDTINTIQNQIFDRAAHDAEFANRLRAIQEARQGG